MKKGESSLPKTPGGRVRLLRKEHNLSQEKLAAAIAGLGGCCAKQIGYIENDRPGRELKRDLAYVLAQYFSVDVAFLMCESDYRTQSEKYRAVISKGAKEADLLYSGLWSFAELTGYKVTPPDLQGEQCVEHAIETIKKGYQIEHKGKTITLSLEEMCHFENMLCDMAESAFRYLFKERGFE